MHIGLCGAKAVGGADVKVDQRNVQRGWSGGSAARAWHRKHGTRALTDLAEAGVLIPIGIFVAATGMGCGYHQACDLWFDVCIHRLASTIERFDLRNPSGGPSGKSSLA